METFVGTLGTNSYGSIIDGDYGATEAVVELSFDIFEGEVFGLLGPNGAGKATTISMLASAHRPSAGDATLFGHSIRNEPAAVRQMIGVAPQEVALYPMLTAAENLRFFGRIYEVQRKEIEGRIDRLLGLVGLEAHRNASAKTFSGGMQRRLNLAVALVHAPKLILLDEPTPGVDPQSREHIFEIIRRLRDAGSAVLYTTHYMEEAEKLCDRLGASLFGNFLDSNEMGKEAVGKPWDSFTPPQQKRFLILFRRLFERTYVDTLLLFERPNFAYLGETRFHGDVRVDTKIITPHDEFAVAYQLRPVGDRWMAINIKVENVNLTANLANQLDHLLSRTSVDDVLDLMQRKYGDTAS